MRQKLTDRWVVYHRPMHGSEAGVRAVCEQHEWEALVRGKPDYYTLIQGDIVSEGEAERLARGNSGERPTISARRSLRSLPDGPPSATIEPALPVVLPTASAAPAGPPPAPFAE